jgi:cytochrome c biogenesis protein CcmG, thiol:disulfide interchange protein DsbE
MQAMRLSFVMPIAFFALIAGLFGYYLLQIGGGKDIKLIPSVLIDKELPSFNLPPIVGRSDGLSSDDLKGKAALVNVFASWCPPCRVEHPVLMRLAKEGFNVYGINYKDKAKDALAFLAELGDPYTRIGTDLNGRAAIEWGVYGYPESFIIDRSGRIRYKQIGAISPRDLETIIRPLLEKFSK